MVRGSHDDTTTRSKSNLVQTVDRNAGDQLDSRQLVKPIVHVDGELYTG
jgi:hypothetical protein